MLRDDDLKPKNVKRIDQEFEEQKAEGKRRQRQYEGIAAPNWTGTMSLSDGRVLKIGRFLAADGTLVTGGKATHKMPDLIEVEEFWDKQSYDAVFFELYPLDPDGLAKEVSDLERDAELMRKHEGVKYE